MSSPFDPAPQSTPLCGPHLRHVFVRDLVIDASIGVYAHEQAAHQRIRVNVDLAVQEDPEGEAERAEGREDLSRVVDYQRVAQLVRATIRGGHVRLAETLAERIAAGCLKLDGRILIARVRVEKLDVFADAAAAGVTVERHQIAFHPRSAIDSQ
jgi:7,8-dihydroneopterin aldolase/epimerase/oxygenase